MVIPLYDPNAVLMLQDHIHLGLVPRDGSPAVGFTPAPEKAPPYRFDAVNKRTPMFSAQMDLVRSWTGVPFDHILTDSNGSPVVFEDIQYDMKLTMYDIRTLRHMLGARVYLVDHFHCADDQDHTPYVKIYRLADLSYGDFLTPMLNWVQGSITLQDMNTVAGL